MDELFLSVGRMTTVIGGLFKPKVPWRAGRFIGHKPHTGKNYSEPLAVDGKGFLSKPSELRLAVQTRIARRAQRLRIKGGERNLKMAMKLLKRAR